MSANLFLTNHGNFEDQINIESDKKFESKPSKELDTIDSKGDDKNKSDSDSGPSFKRFQFYDGKSKFW